MADPITDPAVPPETPPAAQPGQPDNAAFARMRQEAKTAQDQLAAAQAKLTEIERSQLAEVERLKLDVADRDKKLTELSPLADENAKFKTAVDKACTDAIATLPEDKRAAVAELVAYVPLDQRLGAIQKQMTLLGVAPLRGGTITQPPTPQPGAAPGAPPEPGKPRTAAEVKAETWGDAYRARGVHSGPPPESASERARKAAEAAK